MSRSSRRLLRSACRTTAALTLGAMALASPAGAGGGIGNLCAKPEVTTTDSDERVIIFNDRVEVFNGSTLVRTAPVSPGSADIVVSTLGGDDEVEVRTFGRAAMVCTGTGDDELDGGDSVFWVFAEGDLTATAQWTPFEQRFEVWGDADIDTAGRTTIVVYGAGDIVTGDEADYIVVVGEADIESGGGDDEIVTGNQDDRIDAGPGNDTVSSKEGDDRIWGGSNDDWIDSGPGTDRVDGGSGNDQCDWLARSRGPRDRYMNCEIRQIDPSVFEPDPKLPDPIPGQDLGTVLGF